MNRTYSIVYNAALGQYQVASEKTKTRRSKACKLLPIILASLLAPALAVDINDGDIAVNVSDDSNAKWQDYHFKTTNQPDQFGFADWSKALKDYLDNPNDVNIKSAWEMANTTLKDNVANYFGQNNGYLNINGDKTFTLTASETQPTEKNIKAGELIAISVGADKNLTYELNNPLVTPNPEDEPEHTSRLFNIAKDGTLIMVGGEGSSITIKGFKVNTKGTTAYGGAIYNTGNVFLGDNVTFESNTASSSSFSYGGVIYNKGTFSLGDNARFKGNTVNANNAFASGGATVNVGRFSIGDSAQFEDNTATISTTLFSAYSYGGAITNSDIFSLGNNAKFQGNTVAAIINAIVHTNVAANAFTSASGGGIYNSGTIALGNNIKFKGNAATVTTYVSVTTSSDTDINANADVEANGGAIHNNNIATLGNNVSFIQNNAIADATVIIKNSGTVVTANPLVAANAKANANAFGGAINNKGTFTLGNKAIFIANTVAATAGVSSAPTIGTVTGSVNANAYGGAINNNGIFTLGASAQFIKNEAQSKGNAFGGAISNNGVFELKTGTQNDVTMFRGNLANGQANSIHQDINGKFNITGDGTLDMRDPFSGEGTFNKSGNGVWKLGGNNTTGSLNINEGTLYLYAKDEVDNGNKNNANAKVGQGNIVLTDKFILGSGTVLSLGGQGHTIKAGSVDIQDNVTFRFNLDAVTNVNSAIVNFFPSSIPQPIAKQSKIDLDFLGNQTTYLLVKGINFNSIDKISLLIRGEKIADTLLKDAFTLSGTKDELKLDVTKVINNEEVTWNSASDQWNMTDKNWDGRAEKQYLLGDKVVFNEHGNNKNITINAGGVVVSDMVVSGGDYKFSGGVIETTKNVKNLSNPTEKLTIQGGAKVDFTGISGKNNFVGGIFLDKGTLSISTLNQLGTNLSKIKFGTDAILDFKDSVTIDGQNGGDQMVFVDRNQNLEIKIADGKTLAFNSSSSSWGVAIYNSGTFSIGDNVKFEGNAAASSFAWGGAIDNNGTFSLGNNAKFEGNTASSISSASLGGAIFSTYGTFNLGAGAQFTKNEVQSEGSAFGGAIYNSGTFNLNTGIKDQDISLFSGNLVVTLDQAKNATGFVANSIHMGDVSYPKLVSGVLKIIGDGILDMRDPITGKGTVNQKGDTTWKLGGNNEMHALNLEKGTLYLYTQNEVSNGNRLDAKAKVMAGNITTTNMTLGSANNGATLIAGGGNKLSGDKLTMHSGSTLRFNVSNNNIVDTAKNPITANTAVMQWDFKNIDAKGQYTVDVTPVLSKLGEYHLLNSKNALGFNLNQLSLKYFGYDPTTIERIKDTFFLNQDTNNVYLVYGKFTDNGIATWVNTNSSAVWNVADQNWQVVIPNYSALIETFLNQDAVVFGDQGLAEQTIRIDAAHAKFNIDGMLVDATTNYTFNGDGLQLMAGTEIIKQGSGMLAFNNTVIGNVDLQGGSLIIGASSQNQHAKLSGDVIAQSGTTLGGHGTIEGIATLNQGAILSPGNSIGTLTVGELNLRNGSKVVLDTAPNGDSDKIIAKKLTTATSTTSGDITIGQNVTLDILAGAGQWSPSVSYSFMTAEGTITGAFSNVTTNLAFLTPTLVIGANGAPKLVMTRNNVGLGNVAKTYNQSATAGAINALTQGHAVYDAVVSMSDDQARLAYDNLSGELYASTESTLFQNANRLHESMLSRIHENSTGLWLDGWGYTGEIKGDDNAAKVESQGSGLLLGYDWVMKENILIGAAVGYEESKIKIKEYNRKGENRVKSTHLMVYGNVDLDVIELKAGLNYSALRFKANRDINIPTLAGTVNAKYRGHQVHAFVEASKKFNITENYDVAPYLNVAYTMISAKDFTETGSAAALHAKNQSNNRTSVTLGVKNDWYLGSDKNLAITADLGWKHTFGDLTINKRLNFVGSAQSFNIKSAAINKNSAVVGLGIKGQYQDLTIDVGYQGEFNNKVKDHALSAKLKWSF